MAEFTEQDVLNGAKAAWAARRAAYELVGLRNKAVKPLLGWEDIPDESRVWMMNEARAVLNSFGEKQAERDAQKESE